ncbi:rab9 effector protein with kelch motifs isoform X2 [Capsicum chacoense]
MIFMCWMTGAKSGRNTNVKAVHLHSHTATLVGGDKLVIFGGSGKGEANYLNDLHVLDLKTMRWSSPEVRGELNRYQGGIDVLDMDTLMLSKLDVLGPSPGARASHASVNFGSKAITIGRDPTPSELHLHVYTHNHDGKFFVVECSRLLHQKYEEIVREKRQTESKIDQLESYYEAEGGVKKKRLFGLGSEAKNYFGKNT